MGIKFPSYYSYKFDSLPRPSYKLTLHPCTHALGQPRRVFHEVLGVLFARHWRRSNPCRWEWQLGAGCFEACWDSAMHPKFEAKMNGSWVTEEMTTRNCCCQLCAHAKTRRISLHPGWERVRRSFRQKTISRAQRKITIWTAFGPMWSDRDLFNHVLQTACCWQAITVVIKKSNSRGFPVQTRAWRCQCDQCGMGYAWSCHDHVQASQGCTFHARSVLFHDHVTSSHSKVMMVLLFCFRFARPSDPKRCSCSSKAEKLKWTYSPLPRVSVAWRRWTGKHSRKLWPWKAWWCQNSAVRRLWRRWRNVPSAWKCQESHQFAMSRIAM